MFSDINVIGLDIAAISKDTSSALLYLAYLLTNNRFWWNVLPTVRATAIGKNLVFTDKDELRDGITTRANNLSRITQPIDHTHYLTNPLSLRLIGVVGAGINVRHSYSQWGFMTWIRTRVLMVASPVF